MKKLVLIIIITVTALSGCSRQNLTEKEFAVIWQEYLRREFEESFDEKQSIAQREKILNELLSSSSFSLSEVKAFMKKNHGYKYNKIFAE